MTKSRTKWEVSFSETCDRKTFVKKRKQCSFRSDEIEAAIYQLWDRLTMREIEAAFHALKRLSDLPPTSLMDRLAQKTIELSDAITGRNMSSIFLAASRFKQDAFLHCFSIELQIFQRLVVQLLSERSHERRKASRISRRVLWNNRLRYGSIATLFYAKSRCVGSRHAVGLFPFAIQTPGNACPSRFVPPR